MSRQITLEFTEEEARFLMGALDAAPLRGLAAARGALQVAQKIAVALNAALPGASIPSASPEGAQGEEVAAGIQKRANGIPR